MLATGQLRGDTIRKNCGRTREKTQRGSTKGLMAAWTAIEDGWANEGGGCEVDGWKHWRGVKLLVWLPW